MIKLKLKFVISMAFIRYDCRLWICARERFHHAFLRICFDNTNISSLYQDWKQLYLYIVPLPRLDLSLHLILLWPDSEPRLDQLMTDDARWPWRVYPQCHARLLQAKMTEFNRNKFGEKKHGWCYLRVKLVWTRACDCLLHYETRVIFKYKSNNNNSSS